MTRLRISGTGQRFLAGIAAALIILCWQPRPASAECFTGPVKAGDVPRVRFAFIATVADASDHVDPVEGMAAYDWHVELRTEQSYLGKVPPSLKYNGWKYGCHDFRGDGLHTGDRIFVATEHLHAAYLPGDPFDGDVLVWRADGDGWAFYTNAMSGAEFDENYPAQVRQATTLSEILRIVQVGSLPATSTAPAAAHDARGPVQVPLLLVALFALVASRWITQVPRRAVTVNDAD